jgi:predicted N-acetyltransferase YhbS
MLILDRLEVLTEFRRRQLGLRYMRAAIERFGMGCRIVAIKPYPLQLEAGALDPSSDVWKTRMKLGSLARVQRVATTKVRKYYGREGFAAVKGTNLMILDLQGGG